ncbi:MAG: alpha/beta hydrolase, partial [Candidatus Lokiarchaeota archaeon]|nr:alpha/beta hydrolase [Candidatus Lokiarchaeota archaeon]
EMDGEGEPVFLIHGFGVSKEVWIAQFQPLAKHFKVIRFDNRGAGKSERPNEPYVMKMFADDIRGLMDYLNIEKANVIGWSLGGMIAQHFAIKYQNRLNKLILINTMAQWPSDKSGLEMYKNSQIEGYHNKLKDPVSTFYERAKMGFTRDFLKEMKADPKKKFFGLWSAEDLIEQANTNPSTPQDITNQVNALGHMDVLEQLKSIKNEVLVICADKDRQMPKAVNVKIYENLPNAKLVVIEGAGHDSPKERAPEINQLIIDFLRT